MGYWDLGVRADGKEVLDMGRKLGWKGIGLLVPWEGKSRLEEVRKSLEPSKNISLGVVIKSGKASSLGKEIPRARPLAELLAVAGGELEINRAAVERPEVDMLLHPWKGRRETGLDYVMARLAKKNRVSVVFDFNEVLFLSKKGRVERLSLLMAAAGILKKHSSPFILSSGARGAFDMRAPSDLVSFGRVLGFRDPGIKEALSDKIVLENRKRLSGKWIMPGVEIE